MGICLHKLEPESWYSSGTPRCFRLTPAFADMLWDLARTGQRFSLLTTDGALIPVPIDELRRMPGTHMSSCRRGRVARPATSAGAGSQTGGLTTWAEAR